MLRGSTTVDINGCWWWGGAQGTKRDSCWLKDEFRSLQQAKKGVTDNSSSAQALDTKQQLEVRPPTPLNQNRVKKNQQLQMQELFNLQKRDQKLTKYKNASKNANNGKAHFHDMTKKLAGEGGEKITYF